MIDDRFRGILELLLKKSRKNQVQWVTWSDDAFAVEFQDNTRLIVSGDSPEHGPDWVRAVLFGPEGQIVAKATAEASSAQDEHDEFEFLDSVYRDAIRVAHKHDNVFKTIEDSLKADAPVGKTETEILGF